MVGCFTQHNLCSSHGISMLHAIMVGKMVPFVCHTSFMRGLPTLRFFYTSVLLKLCCALFPDRLSLPSFLPLMRYLILQCLQCHSIPPSFRIGDGISFWICLPNCTEVLRRVDARRNGRNEKKNHVLCPCTVQVKPRTVRLSSCELDNIGGPGSTLS